MDLELSLNFDKEKQKLCGIVAIHSDACASVPQKNE